MSNILLKLAESCVKVAAQRHWYAAGFPRRYWGHFFGAPESVYIWMSTVEKYIRLGKTPRTVLTDVSQAFNRVNHELFKRKLFGFGLPRQVIELVLEFMSGLNVHLCWGKVKTKLLDRGNVGAPQGSIEGMWNFGVYADNIHSAISDSVSGVNLGNEMVRDVVYADDITVVNPVSSEINLALEAIYTAGKVDAFKVKATKCKIGGTEEIDATTFRMGDEEIERAATGLLLGAVIKAGGISILEHVMRRAEMVKNGVKQLKIWRNNGVPYSIVFGKLFRAKILPRFSYAFSLLRSDQFEKALPLIEKILDRAMSNCFGWSTPKGVKINPGIWAAICGFPPVDAFLRQEKLLMAARLKLADHKAGRIFRELLKSEGGSFQNDVLVAIDEWLLSNLWKKLSGITILKFKRQVRTLAKKCWPLNLPQTGRYSWLYHNHRVYSGNVPRWADWNWPGEAKYKIGKFKTHFYFLLTGKHPSWSETAICRRIGCKGRSRGDIYRHHFFECENYECNRAFSCSRVRLLLKKSEVGLGSFPLIQNLLREPCAMWVGLMIPTVVASGLKLKAIHELHRVFIISSVLSWGRFYDVPMPRKPEEEVL